MLLFLISLQSAILRVSYEQHCTLVTQSECRCFYVLAISENISDIFCSVEKSVTKKVLQRYYKLLISTFRAGGNISISPFRSSQTKAFYKKGDLKNFAKFTGRNFIQKEIPTQVFSRKFFEIFKSTYFTVYIRTTAFVCFWKLAGKKKENKFSSTHDSCVQGST